MREIKFRAFDKSDGRMLSVSEPEPENQGKREYYPFMVEVGFSHWMKEDIVLMQWTGLLDKNGIEVYEGDIVQYTEWKNNSDEVSFSTKYRVEWQMLKWCLVHLSESYSVQLWQHLKPEIIQNLNNDGCKAREFEVIGNIHQSPPAK